jgi:radical SAM superfamily enzyme YgiQ (UPF0313 family)
MGGPHVTEVPDEALGRDGGVRHADAVALGEADETWPTIVMDAARGELKEIYAPLDETGKERKPSLQPYPEIPWNTMDLEQFDLVPKPIRGALKRQGSGWGSVHMIPIESGRGCPYGCEFCTVTGFFGDSIRFRTNESVVNELLTLKRHARQNRKQVMVFFIDDNFAINIKRTKSLLRTSLPPARSSLDGADQRKSSARRRVGRSDCRFTRQMDLHRHGIDRFREPGRRKQELQQAG